MNAQSCNRCRVSIESDATFIEVVELDGSISESFNVCKECEQVYIVAVAEAAEMAEYAALADAVRNQ